MFYKIESGVVRMCKFLNGGNRLIAAFHIAGEFFGLELGNERQFSAEAVTDCNLIVYQRATVERQAKSGQVISQQLFQPGMLQPSSAI